MWNAMSQRLVRAVDAPFMCDCGHWMKRHDGSGTSCIYCGCKRFVVAAPVPPVATPQEEK